MPSSARLAMPIVSPPNAAPLSNNRGEVAGRSRATVLQGRFSTNRSITYVAITTLASIVHGTTISRTSTRSSPGTCSAAHSSTAHNRKNPTIRPSARRKPRSLDCAARCASKWRRGLGGRNSVRPILVRALDAERDGVAAAEAERGKTLFRTTILHRVQKRRQDTRSARSDRMSERDRAAVDVDALPIPAELFAVSDGLRCECFVGLDQIVVADLGPRLLHQISHGLDRCEEEIFRLGSSGGVPGDAAEYLEVVSLGVFLGDDDERGGAVVEARCIS